MLSPELDVEVAAAGVVPPPEEEEDEDAEALEEEGVEAATAPPVTTSACASTSITAVLSPARSLGQATFFRGGAAAPSCASVPLRLSFGGFQTRICFGTCFGWGLGRESCLLTVIGASPPGNVGSLILTPC